MKITDSLVEKHVHQIEKLTSELIKDVNLIIERYADDFIGTELKHNSAKSLNLKKNVPDLDV